MAIALKPFDASRDFVAQTNFRADGSIWLRKQPFDKGRVNERVLRQLYEARKIAYAPDQPDLDPNPLDLPADHGDLDPLEQHEAEVAQEQQDTEGASGTAREAPGAEESTSATSGEASAPSETTAAAPETAGPAKEEAAAAPGGETETAAAGREELIKQLVRRHTHDELFAKASGIKGVKKKQTKDEIAAAIVDAGRAGDGAA